EINRVANQSQFNGIKILAGSSTATTISIQVGANDGQKIDISISGNSAWNKFDSTGTAGTTTGLASGESRAVTTKGFDVLSTNVLAAVDASLKAVDTQRSDLGAIQNRFESTISNLNNTVTNLSAAQSRIQDADYATEVSNMSRAQILQQAGTSVLSQANQVPQSVLSLLR
ncbi:MAG TPA: flagellin, partial [Buttiauxella sp.]